MLVEKEGERAIFDLHGFQFAGKAIAVAKASYDGTKNDEPASGFLL
jgi:hypothetical protein